MINGVPFLSSRTERTRDAVCASRFPVILLDGGLGPCGGCRTVDLVQLTIVKVLVIAVSFCTFNAVKDDVAFPHVNRVRRRQRWELMPRQLNDSRDFAAEDDQRGAPA